MLTSCHGGEADTSHRSKFLKDSFRNYRNWWVFFILPLLETSLESTASLVSKNKFKVLFAELGSDLNAHQKHGE